MIFDLLRIAMISVMVLGYGTIGYFTGRATVRYEALVSQVKFARRYPTFYMKESARYTTGGDLNDWQKYCAALHLLKSENLPVLFTISALAWPVALPIEALRRHTGSPREGVSFIGGLVPEFGDEERDQFANLQAAALPYKLKEIDSRHRDLGIEKMLGD